MDSMFRKRLVNLVHWIGYFTTALVIAEAGLLGFTTIDGWPAKSRGEAVMRVATRARDGPLDTRSGDGVAGAAVYSLEGLPASGALCCEGFRYVALPSFGSHWYAITMALTDGTCDASGTLQTIELRREKGALLPSARSKRRFTIQRTAYLVMLKKIDTLTDKWPGEPGFCSDGTGIAFERVRSGKITSSVGNASCSKHFGAINLAVLEALRQSAPSLGLTVDNEWMTPEAYAAMQ